MVKISVFCICLFHFIHAAGMEVSIYMRKIHIKTENDIYTHVEKSLDNAAFQMKNT